MLIGLLVLGDLVHQGVGARVEEGLGVLEGVGSGSLGGGELGVEVGHGTLLREGVLAHLGVELLGGDGEVLLEGDDIAGLLGAELLDVGVGLLGEGLGSLGSDLLVLVLESLDDAAGLRVGGLVVVGELGNTAELALHLGVDDGLGGLGGANLHVGAGLVHGLLGLGAGSLKVLDGLGEAHILEGGESGDLVVEGSGLLGEGLSDLAALLGHGLGVLGELLVGSLGGGVNAVGDSLDDGVVALGGGLGHGSELGTSGLAGLVEGSLDGSGVGGHLRLDGSGVGLHLGSSSGEVGVGLLNLLGGLLLLGEKGGLLGSDGVGDLLHGVGLVSGDLGLHGGALGTTLLLLGKELGVESGELALGPGDGILEVLGSELGSIVDSGEGLLLHLGTGLGGLELDLIELRVNGVTEGLDLLVDAGLHGGASGVVHLLGVLLDLESLSLTLGDGGGDGGLHGIVVGVGHNTELSTALSGLDGVGLHHTGEVKDGLVVLLEVVLDSASEVTEALGEVGAGVTELGGGLELHGV